ncbi:MAG: HTTM domain-containing protein [Planctomycetota bacterium]
MSSIVRGVHRFWFAEEDPRHLALVRILLTGALIGLYLPRDLGVWGSVPYAFWFPQGSFEVLGFPKMAEADVAALSVIWKISLVTLCLGLQTRCSAWVACTLGLYLVGLQHNFGKVNHGNTLVPIALFVLAFSRCGDALSVDAWLGRRQRPLSPAGDYRWPLRLLQVALLGVFFAAGVSKLRPAGWDWSATENLRNVLVLHHCGAHRPPTSIGLWLASSPFLYKPFAAIALFSELAAPLALARRFRVPVLAGLIALILGIFVLFGFAPFSYLPLFFAFVRYPIRSRSEREETVATPEAALA